MIKMNLFYLCLVAGNSALFQSNVRVDFAVISLGMGFDILKVGAIKVHCF